MSHRTATSRAGRSFFPIVAVALLGACSQPIEGEWRSDYELPNGERNKIDFDGDLVGSATIYATPEDNLGAWQRFKFSADAYEREDGFSWLVKMKCKDGPCDGNNFEMTCEVIEPEADDELEKMNCKGKERWESYPFDFERVEE